MFETVFVTPAVSAWVDPDYFSCFFMRWTAWKCVARKTWVWLRDKKLFAVAKVEIPVRERGWVMMIITTVPCDMWCNEKLWLMMMCLAVYVLTAECMGFDWTVGNALLVCGLNGTQFLMVLRLFSLACLTKVYPHNVPLPLKPLHPSCIAEKQISSSNCSVTNYHPECSLGIDGETAFM